MVQVSNNLSNIRLYTKLPTVAPTLPACPGEPNAPIDPCQPIKLVNISQTT